ncbi:hypothetical protein DKL61_07020 [Gammaproteobacteria bacterium ESL0073]|nr:hypothetical protein DKL61_06905 [Gammaproteobacteria bacterium ESL0073]AWM80116.1 hypothetical protein DKL61_06965 [Gammaproteobacteria bacterium ESL0073]AWM80126.1 hypothetical protein DKL61_07020 [Gammaproteobacteria bacterium ESL0073]
MAQPNQLFVRVISHGTFREGTSQKGNAYIMGEAFAFESDANNPYPQKISYYCESKDDVLKSGEWAVPVSYLVRDNRLDFRLNTKEAVPYELIFPKPKPAVQANGATPSTTATKAN